MAGSLTLEQPLAMSRKTRTRVIREMIMMSFGYSVRRVQWSLLPTSAGSIGNGRLKLHLLLEPWYQPGKSCILHHWFSCLLTCWILPILDFG
jgi:hypothetical protein